MVGRQSAWLPHQRRLFRFLFLESMLYRLSGRYPTVSSRRLRPHATRRLPHSSIGQFSGRSMSCRLGESTARSSLYNNSVARGTNKFTYVHQSPLVFGTLHPRADGNVRWSVGSGWSDDALFGPMPSREPPSFGVSLFQLSSTALAREKPASVIRSCVIEQCGARRTLSRHDQMDQSCRAGNNRAAARETKDTWLIASRKSPDTACACQKFVASSAEGKIFLFMPVLHHPAVTSFWIPTLKRKVYEA